MKYWVKTNTSLEYIFFAKRFEIYDGIVHFYDEEGNPVWVIKDWLGIGCSEEEEEDDKEPEKSMSPDEYFENLK